jgi:orotate phosphoribosyltransferase
MLIEELLINSPGVFNYDKNNYFEVRPGRVSPLLINIKNILSNIKLRKIITKKLLKKIRSDTDCVCGIESGGTYFASIAAFQLNQPLILYRKKAKTYAEKGRFVGALPANMNNVAVVDDVIASGSTIEPVIDNLKSMGCNIHVYTVFSYGNDAQIIKNLLVELSSITNINNLLPILLKKEVLPLKEIDFLYRFFKLQKK